jgi:hypothetical protein
VAALKKPAKVCQATRLTKEQWDEVLPHYQPDPFQDFTGCRPQEIEVMAARRLDLATMMVRFGLPFGVAGPRQHPLDSTFTEAHPHRAGGPFGP